MPNAVSFTILAAVSAFESPDADSRSFDAPALPPPVRRAAMLEHPTLAVAAIEQGRIRLCNAPWKTLFAVPAEVSVDSHVATLFANVSSADRFERGLSSDLRPDEQGGVTARSEHMLMRRNGSAFLGEVVIWFDGEPGGEALQRNAVWQVRDITVERTLRRELVDLEQYHRELSRQRWDMTFVIDRKGRISYASTSIEEILGYDVDALLGEPFSLLLEPANIASAEQWLRGASRRDAPRQAATADAGHPLRVLHVDGGVRVLTCRPRDCFGVPRIAGMVVHARDATGAVLADAERGEAEAVELRAILAGLCSTAARSPELRIDALRVAIKRSLGASTVIFWPVGGVPERPSMPDRGGEAVVDTAMRHESRPPLLSRADAVPAGMPLIVGDVRSADAPVGDLEVPLLSASAAAVLEVPVFDGGQLLGWLAVTATAPRRWTAAQIDFVIGCGLSLAPSIRRCASSDAAERGVSPVAEATPARLDPLTGLVDRNGAEEQLAARMAAREPSGSLVAIVVGLDRLNDINDGWGYAVGDAILVQTADLLREMAGADGFVARLGGDEFLCLLRDVEPHDVDAIVQSLLRRVCDVPGRDPGAGSVVISIDASVGIAFFGDDVADGTSLLLRADRAMRDAKRRGHGLSCTFDDGLARGLLTRSALGADIEGALARREFTMFYQPQIALDGGEVIGLEALLRWQHPTRGLLLPEAFIGAAFEHGLIDAITKLALHEVCEQIAAWRRDPEMAEVPVAVNVSGRQFSDRRLPSLVASALLKSGLPARLLVLEVTEQSLVGDEAEVERVLKELSRLGVRIAISDFNVGHALFRHLRRLHVTQIKLAREFVAGLPGDADSAIVVAAFVDLAHRLGCQVIAEGVETSEQFEHLRAIGCEFGQGFHLGAPQAPKEISAFLAASRKSPLR